MKKIRRPLTDINGRDFMTGEVVNDPYEVDLLKDAMERACKWLRTAERNSLGQVKVEGFGRCTI